MKQADTSGWCARAGASARRQKRKTVAHGDGARSRGDLGMRLAFDVGTKAKQEIGGFRGMAGR
ncbi:hypothetical protein, partial [Mesorhizobium metallidurans]|uniref:hypothetical protein n=1 Tax=Mesorhizobium metallidurans TaxID=489722 RepID=UPI0012FB3E8F